MNLKETLRKEWFVLLLLFTPFIISAFLWNDLPEEVPTHFNFKGEADDWGPGWVIAFLLPGIGLGVYCLLLLLPVIDPKKRISSIQKPIAAIRIVSSVFFIGIYALVMAEALGNNVNLDVFIRVGVGALILVIGNYMNSIKPNYFIGLRTPWTLEHPEVWKKTHRFGSRIWVIGGLFLMILPFIPVLGSQEVSFISVIVLLVGVPFIYSYLESKKIEKVL